MANKTSPERIRTLKLLDQGEKLLDEGKVEEACQILREATSVDPTYPWSYIKLAKAVSLIESDEKGVEVLSSARETIRDGIITCELAKYLVDLGRTKDAEVLLEEALQGEVTPYVLDFVGGLFEKLQNTARAIECHRRALEIEPNYRYALGALGRIELERGNIEEAITLLESANREAESDSGSNFWAADLALAKSRQRQKDQWEYLPTIDEMRAYLDRFVCAQENAKETLTTAIYSHYISLSYRDSNVLNPDLGRYNALLFGPSGSGKTYMIELLTKKLGVPLVIESATSLVQTGYVGKKIDSIMEDLLVASDYKVSRAERGIVFIDEIDKVRISGRSGGPDVSGEGVQNGLLTMLEGKEFRIENSKGTFTIDSSKVLFIAAGAFDGLIDIVKSRLGRSHGKLGFGAPSATSSSERSDAELLSVTSVEDLRTFGIIPQLVGRFSAISHLTPLQRDDLKAILTKMEGSVIEKQKRLFQIHGVDLEFTPDSLEAILDVANSAQTGARGLRTAIHKSIRPISSKIATFVSDGVSKVTITKETVETGAMPRIARNPTGKVDDSEAVKLRRQAFARLAPSS